MATDHADTVKDLLDAAGVSNVLRGLMRDGPNIADDSVFVETTGGFAPDSYFGGESVDSPTVQIMIRGTKGRRDEAHTTARACFDAIDHVEPSGYMSCVPQQGTPISIKTDGEGRPLFTVNAVLQIDE